MKTVVCLALSAMSLAARAPNPAQDSSGSQPAPVYRVTVVSRTTQAVNYHHRQGSTDIEFRGTTLMPDGRGKAKVDSRTGSTKIEAEFDRLQPARMFGPEFLTYVLWAITPEGRAQNIGEVYLDGNKSKLLATTELQAFGMIVTAEPYYAVTQPSNVVVMENFVGRGTTGTIEPIQVKYDLLERGAYIRGMAPPDVQRLAVTTSVPLDLQEARNALAIARSAGADQYASDTMARAGVEMQNAENYYQSRSDTKKLQSVARQATQLAEDARLISLRKQEEEAQAAERAAAAQRLERARTEAEQQAQQRAQAEAESARLAEQKAAADQSRIEAERAKREADEAAQRAAQQQQQLQAEAEKARLDAQEAERGRQQAEQEKTDLRAQLVRQFNTILETRDTARGLIVNMSDVLFDTGRYSLRPGAREKLARIAGIIQSHPGLKLEIEGHTDNIGSEEYNQRLSEQRAEAVRDYLMGQGVSGDTVTARGLGKSTPVASNATAAGRQQNRRVEMVVSGDVIGTRIGPSDRTYSTDGP